ncbi:N-acetylmuramoyl-L-alanine amidase [Stackebrandtia soli]|uniref:golvesin C-terminal-like domain-containing protein n=1 Tax=Stackebrandtia soli TaxID=1892856 RepID=UPI0039ED5D9C
MSPSPRISRRAALRGAVVVGVGAAVGGATILTTSSASADVPSPDIAGCADWGARAPGGLTQLPNGANKIVIHHTASANQADTSKEAAFQLARDIQGWHMDGNGWADSGQHFTVSRGGYVMEGRHTSLDHLSSGSGMVQGAHAPGANTDGIGIENEGTYTSETPPAALYDSLVTFCAYICQQYGIPSSEIYGHRDFVATACPGEAFYAMLPQLRADVQAVLDGGGNPGAWSVTIDNGDAGFTMGAGWALSSYAADKHGDNYAFASPAAEDGTAVFSAEIPEEGVYSIETWHGALPGYNPSAPFTVHAGDGDHAVTVDQTSNGGQWVGLGQFTLPAGQRDLVSVSRRTDGAGYVLADAIRVTKV